MRKVTLKVKAKVMVPLILTYNVTANVDEGVPMESVARAAIQGKIPDNMDIEDSSFDVQGVEDTTAEDPDDRCGLCGLPLLERQISEYVEGEDRVNPTYLSHEVEDSR